MLLRLSLVFFFVLLPFINGAYADSQFDGAWQGTIDCSRCDGCDGPITKSLGFEIVNGSLEVDNSYSNFGQKISGKVNLEGGFFSSAGDISISGRYFGGNELKDFFLRGKYAPQTIKLSGTRGPRKCSGKLQRIESSAE